MLFLAVVVALYWLLRERRKQNALRVLAGFVFYTSRDWRFLSLLTAAIGVLIAFFSVKPYVLFI
jgi:hypothetical protein